MATPRESLKSALRHQSWLPTVVVAGGVLVTIVLYQALEHREAQVAQMRFESIAEDHIQALERRTRDIFQAVHLLAGFYHGPGEIGWGDFQIYANSIRERRPGLRMLIWAPRVTGEQREQFVAAAPMIGGHTFTITELNEQGDRITAEPRNTYFPVYFVKPFDAHKPLWGLDLLTQPAAGEAIQRAEQTGELHATAPIILLSDLGPMRSIWAFQAVHTMSNDSQQTSAEAVHGVVAGVFEPGAMISAILPRFRQAQILLEIRDRDAAEPYDLIYHSQHAAGQRNVQTGNPKAGVDEAVAQASWRIASTVELDDEQTLPLREPDVFDDHQILHTETITVAGRTWYVRAVPTNDFLQAHRTWAPLAVLAGGLGVTVLLGLYLSNLLTRARQIEQEVDHRTTELREMASALRRSNESLKEFAYIASHDLQEPLRKVRGFSEMLTSEAGDALNEQQRDYIARMQNAATRMQDLITGLLAYSRVTTQRQPPQMIDLTQIAHQVVADLELRIRETRGRVEVDALPRIEADPIQMRQLFQNLISNALKFHRPDEPPEVHVRGEVLRSGRCRIEVQDNGIGFSPEEAERIFKPFQRLHGRDAYDGTGMGLALCKKIVEQHGGSITARSQPGQGATFTIILPCGKESGNGHGWSESTTAHAADGR